MASAPYTGKPWHARASPLARSALLVYGLLLLYAGLAPWSGWRSLGVAPWAYLTAPVPRHLTTFDLIVNVVGYMPLGALVVLAVHPRIRAAVGALLALVAGVLLSGTIEALQTFLVSRIPSNIDLLTNSAGAFAGGIAIAPFTASLIDRGRLAELRLRWFERQSSLLLLLVALWPLAQLYPAPMLFGTGDLRQVLEDVVAALGGTWPAFNRADFQVAEFILAEAFVVAASVIAVGLAFAAAMRPAAPRASLIIVLLVATLALKALAQGVFFGPERALIWLTPGAWGGLAIGALSVLAASAGPAPWRPRFALLALAAALIGANFVPYNPYYLANMQDWRQGELLNFHSLTRWLSMLWPYALALVLLGPAAGARALR